VKLSELLDRLTLEEKAGILVGVGGPHMFPGSRVPGAAGETHPVPRVGIPSFVLADGPAGVRIEGGCCTATAFPVAVMLASTWSPEIVEKVGRAIGEEALAYGVDVLLAPALNIHRNPLGGRLFEYFSEDPLLSGVMAAAYVRGVQSTGVGACVKHFVANEQETGRWGLDTVVSERALREIYLRAFEIAVKEGRPWAVMSAYNKLNGVHCSENEWLLTRVLREEWGFQGFVMTDWGAGEDVSRQLRAGNDMIMPGGEDKVKELLEAVRSGKLGMEVVDRSLERVLRVLADSPAFKGYKPSMKPDLEEHARIAYEAAAEGLVLLENNQALPLPADARIAFFGTGHVATVKGGQGSGHTHPPYVSTVLNAARERGLRIDEELAKTYEEALKDEMPNIEQSFKDEPDKPTLSENFLSESIIEASAARSDAAVVVFSRVSGEGYDLTPEEFYLSSDERWLLEKVSNAFRSAGKKVIVVLNIGNPIEVASWRGLADAILLAWQPGQEAGRVIVDALTGRINPSGKLPVTFPRDYAHVPSWTFPGEPPDNPKRVVYEEGIYVGYRYYDTFGVEPAYPFGHGLSYTTFAYKDLDVTLTRGEVRIRFQVTNTGKLPGKEVAQVYVRAPKGRLDKPFQELKGFKKTRLLNPGESELVEVTVKLSHLASFDGSHWLLEKGTYEVRVGSSSRDIRLTGYFTIPSEERFTRLE